jgi:Mor family transcriptional regulator
MPPDDTENFHRKDAKSAKGELVKKWGGVSLLKSTGMKIKAAIRLKRNTGRYFTRN